MSSCTGSRGFGSNWIIGVSFSCCMMGSPFFKDGGDLVRLADEGPLDLLIERIFQVQKTCSHRIGLPLAMHAGARLGIGRRYPVGGNKENILAGAVSGSSWKLSIAACRRLAETAP